MLITFFCLSSTFSSFFSPSFYSISPVQLHCPFSLGSSLSESSSSCRGVIMLRSCCSGSSDWIRRRQRFVGWRKKLWLCGTKGLLGMWLVTCHRVRNMTSLTSVFNRAQDFKTTVKKVKHLASTCFAFRINVEMFIYTLITV